MSNPSIGTRVYGKRSIGERWYQCAILDEHVPESQTIIIPPPRDRAGMRVCLRCYDDMSYDERVRMNPPIPSTTENEP